MNQFKIQLYGSGPGSQAGEIIDDAGGFITVCAAGDATKQAILDSAGASKTNGFALTGGGAEFWAANTVSSVDVYIMTPGGQFVVKAGVVPGLTEIAVDTQQRNQVAKIPFSATDSTAATEKDTGYDFPANSAVLPTPMILVSTVDATETIDFGLLSSETNGDADGFGVTVSVATAGLVKATVLQGSNTMGALFEVQDSANAGDLTHEQHVVTGANATSITYTTTAGTDTAEGFLILPYLLAA